MEAEVGLAVYAIGYHKNYMSATCASPRYPSDKKIEGAGDLFDVVQITQGKPSHISTRRNLLRRRDSTKTMMFGPDPSRGLMLTRHGS